MPSRRKVKKAQSYYGLPENRARAALRNAKTIERSEAKVDRQRKAAATRAKYGPLGRPAPVVVRRLDG